MSTKTWPTRSTIFLAIIPIKRSVIHAVAIFNFKGKPGRTGESRKLHQKSGYHASTTISEFQRSPPLPPPPSPSPPPKKKKTKKRKLLNSG